MSHAPLYHHAKQDGTPVRSILAAWTIAAALLAVGFGFSSSRHHDASATVSTSAHFRQATKPVPSSGEDDVAW
ncbi:MAG TPA: hypothetical protein VHT04_09800 [Stellaceae bacterium]|nr:hypothetical protein [Stellaceae bacterium]